MKNKNKYKKTWLAFVNINAKSGFKFYELVDNENEISNKKLKGAWANIIIKANTINEVLEIIPNGLSELNFELIFIDKIENIASLIEQDELKKSVITEVKWLLKSDFVFKISEKLFPYKK